MPIKLIYGLIYESRNKLKNNLIARFENEIMAGPVTGVCTVNRLHQSPFEIPIANSSCDSLHVKGNSIRINKKDLTKREEHYGIRLKDITCEKFRTHNTNIT